MPWRFTVVRFALGGLLLAAAGLKLYGLSVSAIPRVGWFSQPWVQLAAVEWEVILGLWLLAGSYSRGAWLAAFLTFAAFAAVSGYLGWIGVASCGCFGVFQASPWWAFGIDTAAVAILALSRPKPSESKADLGALVWVGGVALLMTAIGGGGIAVYGSFDAALARLRGESLSVSPSVLNLGRGKPNDLLSGTVTVSNLSDEPLRLIGGKADCLCLITQNLPLTIAGRGRAEIPVSLRVPSRSTAGQFVRTAVLFTDRDDLPRIDLNVVCRVDR